MLVNVGTQLQPDADSAVLEDPCFRLRCRSIFVGLRLGLIFALINIVGVEFLINYGGLGQLINDLAERYDLAGTYAAICFVILVSVLFFMRWKRSSDGYDRSIDHDPGDGTGR